MFLTDHRPPARATFSRRPSQGKRLRAYFSSNLGGTLTLVHALQNDTDELVRHYTAFSLGRIGSPEAIPSLIHALRSDSSDEVRSHAARR